MDKEIIGEILLDCGFFIVSRRGAEVTLTDEYRKISLVMTNQGSYELGRMLIRAAKTPRASK